LDHSPNLLKRLRPRWPDMFVAASTAGAA